MHMAKYDSNFVFGILVLIFGALFEYLLLAIFYDFGNVLKYMNKFAIINAILELSKQI